MLSWSPFCSSCFCVVSWLVLNCFWACPSCSQVTRNPSASSTPEIAWSSAIRTSFSASHSLGRLQRAAERPDPVLDEPAGQEGDQYGEDREQQRDAEPVTNEGH